MGAIKKRLWVCWGATGYVLTQSTLNELINKYPNIESKKRHGRETSFLIVLLSICFKRNWYQLFQELLLNGRKLIGKQKEQLIHYQKIKCVFYIAKRQPANPM